MPLYKLSAAQTILQFVVGIGTIGGVAGVIAGIHRLRSSSLTSRKAAGRRIALISAVLALASGLLWLLLAANGFFEPERVPW
ncbi:MAG: hypothetical protein H6707_20115 [Deltaproteobacteria bacterium]|nr:hypothetical protein [Deltaproteobacteria bacterium]